MRVTKEMAKAFIGCEADSCDFCINKSLCCANGTMASLKIVSADLIEARELIKEMQKDLLKLSQYPIAFVCEEARIIAREAWKKSKEYAE